MLQIVLLAVLLAVAGRWVGVRSLVRDLYAPSTCHSFATFSIVGLAGSPSELLVLTSG